MARLYPAASVSGAVLHALLGVLVCVAFLRGQLVAAVKVPTTITLSSSQTPSSAGQPVTFTAIVASSSGPPPDGETVSFRFGATILGDSPLQNGRATFTTPMAAGTYSMTAVYWGDPDFGGKTSARVVQSVHKISTAISINSSLPTSAVGQQVAFTATLSSDSGVPLDGEIVGFEEHGTRLGQAALSAGTATFQTSSLTAGGHVIVAVYDGDDVFAAANSPGLLQSVDKMPVSISLDSMVNPSTYGEAATIRATLSSGDAIPPDGEQVTFRDGATVLGTGILAAGEAMFATSSLPRGTRRISAVYSGDDAFSGKTSKVLLQVVSKIPTTITVTSSQNPSTWGDPVTFFATLSTTGPMPPDGEDVTFRAGSTVLGAAPIHDGVAQFAAPSLDARGYSINAIYYGDDNFSGKTSPSLVQAVQKAPTITTLTTSANPVFSGDMLTFTATVQGSAGTPSDGETVLFKNSGTLIGTGTLHAGVATLETSSLLPGTRVIKAFYPADSTFLSSTGTATQQVKHPPSCDPATAGEIVAAQVQNNGSEALQGYPFPISLDETDFDFSFGAADGSDLAAWDASSRTPIPFWLESYDSVLKKALVWVNLPSVGAQSSTTVWITSGAISNCALQTGNGYQVFPFFSDVKDAANWASVNQLQVSDSVTTGPLSVQDVKTIQSDGYYNSTPGLAEAANGDWLLSYRKGTTHTNNPLVILRRSQDHGQTWSPELTAYDDNSGVDPTLARTPGGDLLLEFQKSDGSGSAGAAYARSTDNGSTWSPFTFFDDPVSNTSAFPTQFISDGSIMYAASYGGATIDSLRSPFLWMSGDDGLTWEKRSEMRSVGDPELTETSVIQTTPGSLFAVSRSQDKVNTYGRYSNDMGASWGPLLSYTSQVGTLQLPQLVQMGSALVLLGREALWDPIVKAPSPLGYPRQLVAFVSYDGGQTFGYGTVLDKYQGLSIDGGYCAPLLQPDGTVFLAYYNEDVNWPDIKSLVLHIGPPATAPSASLHITSRFAPGLATQSTGLTSTRYSLDFRFRSREVPASGQFSVELQDDSGAQAVPVVNWELPSTHDPSDPASTSGFISDENFVPALDTFAYEQTYRIRSIVDETQNEQTGQILDAFGAVIGQTGPQPLAAGVSAHATTIGIGNNSDLRSTDTLLDFVFLRPLATTEPSVTFSRLR